MSNYTDELINNYNCPDCNDAKLQSDKNARKINEVIDQVNALIQVNNETVDFIEEKANELVGEVAVIKVNEIIEDKQTKHDSFYRYARIQPTINIGDSISEGSNCSDYVNNSWCGLLNKAYQKKYNVRNQGFVNFNTYVVENNDNINTFHKIKRVGFDIHQNCFEDSVFGGTRITSVNADEYIEINYNGKDFYVVYTQDETYGAIVEVQVDNHTIGQIDTKKLNGIQNGSISPRVPVGEYGNHTIQLINKGGTAQLCGIIYVEDSTSFSPVFYNVGRSSIALSDISDDILKYYASYGTVIFSLGVNDQLLSKDINIFKDKLDLMFSKIRKSSGNCIVNDFMFSLPQDNEYKLALKEYTSKYEFELIDYGALMLQGIEPNKFIKYLDSDGVHPTSEGHEFIYSILANKLGLPYTKADLNETLTINIPTLRNSWVNFVDDNSHRNACYYKKSNIVYLEGMIKGGMTAPYTELFTLPAEFRPSSDIYFPVACSGEIGQITIAKDGIVKIVSGNNSWLSLNGISYYV